MRKCNNDISLPDIKGEKEKRVNNVVKEKKANKINWKIGNKSMIWNKGNSSFMAKKDSIEILISNHKPLTLGILEANVEPDSHPPSLVIDGYILELDNLHEKGLKARSVIYIKKEANYKRRKDLEPPLSPTIWLEFNSGTKGAWLLFLGYREWRTLHCKDKQKSQSTKEQLVRLTGWEESWIKANEEEKPIVIMGDLNVDAETWMNPKLKKNANNQSVLNQMMSMSSLIDAKLLKSEPTRYQGKAKPSTLDLVLTTKVELLSNLTLHNSESDHKVISVIYSSKPIKSKPQIVSARSYKRKCSQHWIYQV